MSTSTSTTDPRFGDRGASISRVRELIDKSSNQGEGWDKAWEESMTPWDANAPQPALISTLKHQDQLFPKAGKALVAGCGRGYDVLCLAERGLQAVGVDISSTAVTKAREWLESQPDSEARSRASFAVSDFFKLGSKEDGEVGEGFDLAYDYTFFCAIPPALRTSWAASYARIIKSGGVLFTLVYPIHGDREGGPPYSVRPDIYSSLLEKDFELIHQGVPIDQKDTHVGVEEVMIWRRK